MGNIDPRTRIRKNDPRRQNGPEHCEHGNTKKSKNFYLPKGASCTARVTNCRFPERAFWRVLNCGHHCTVGAAMRGPPENSNFV